MVYASGFAMGVIWLVLGLTGVTTVIARLTPRSVIRGIQITLGVLLAVEAVKLIWPAWPLGLAAVGIILLHPRAMLLSTETATVTTSGAGMVAHYVLHVLHLRRGTRPEG